MRLSTFFFALLLLALGASDARAQAGSDWWDWAARSERRADRDDDRSRDRRDRDDDWDDDDRYEDRDDDSRRGRRDSRRARKNDGPKFCQNGQGHPTKGMRWCREKGYAPRGSIRHTDRRDRDRRAPRWERRSVEDVIFGSPRRTDRRDRRERDRRAVLSADDLRDVLGTRRYTQLSRVADGSVAARWLYPSRTVRVLQVRDRQGPLAELTDYDGDGRVDVFLTNGRR